MAKKIPKNRIKQIVRDEEYLNKSMFPTLRSAIDSICCGHNEKYAKKLIEYVKLNWK